MSDDPYVSVRVSIQILSGQKIRLSSVSVCINYIINLLGKIFISKSDINILNIFGIAAV